MTREPGFPIGLPMFKTALGGVNQFARRSDQQSFVLAKLHESGCGFACQALQR
jgi:hypothetical protein